MARAITNLIDEKKTVRCMSENRKLTHCGNLCINTNTKVVIYINVHVYKYQEKVIF